MVGTNPSTPISGTLYKCTSTNTWTAYYTPYTYPHPLRLESPAQTCGNNIREGSETCDGTDLAGQTCVSRGFTGGTISCSSNCLSFVTTSCTSQQACPNGICGAGETCSSCPQDCGACSSSGLIAWWKLDETSGTTASDSSGSSTGTLVNGPVWTAGNLSNGLSFDGVNDYVDISGVASLIDKNQGSFAAWILIDRYFTSTLPSNYGIIEVGSSVSSNNGITLSPNPTASAIIMHYRNNGVSTISSASVPTGAWHHVVGTWTASALTIYVDGVLVDSDSNGAITTATLNQARIGSDGLGTTGQAFFDGSIDDVRIYNRALNASEIQALYQSGSSVHKSDNNPADGCVSMEELTAFISLWYLDSSNPSLKELIEAIGLWKRGGC